VNKQAAIASRDAIGQAKGILMAREQVGADEAFELFRTRFQQHHRKLRDIAQAIIEEHGSSCRRVRPSARGAATGCAVGPTNHRQTAVVVR